MVAITLTPEQESTAWDALVRNFGRPPSDVPPGLADADAYEPEGKAVTVVLTDGEVHVHYDAEVLSDSTDKTLTVYGDGTDYSVYYWHAVRYYSVDVYDVVEDDDEAPE